MTSGLSSANVYSVLIILPHNPGDVVMGLSVLSELHHWNNGRAFSASQTRIDFVVSEECAELVQGHPYLNKVYELPTSHVKHALGAANVEAACGEVRELVRKICEVEYDCSVNLFQEDFGAILHGLIKAKHPIGYLLKTESHTTHYVVENRLMEHLFAIPVAREQNPWHVIDIYQRALGLTSSKRSIPEFPPITLKAGMESFVRKGPKENPLGVCGIQLGSAWREKRWPVVHWAKLIEKMITQCDQLVFFGTIEEESLYQNLWNCLSNSFYEQHENKIISLIGKTTLLHVKEALKQCDRLITGDTVTMHLSAGVGTPTVVLFGSSNPVETGPYGEGHYILQKNIQVPEVLFQKEQQMEEQVLEEEGENASGIEQIKPEHVMKLLLKEYGKGVSEEMGNDVHVWKTTWNSHLKMQLLKSVDEEEIWHPFQQHLNVGENERLGALQAWLPEDRVEESAVTGVLEVAQEVLDQVRRCYVEQNAETLRVLNTLDAQLAEKTQNNVIWESYRIAINSFSLNSLELYLKKRKERLLLALEEYTAHNVVFS